VSAIRVSSVATAMQVGRHLTASMSFLGRILFFQDSPTTTLPRKQSFSTLQSPGVGARSGPMPSPRVRQGFSGGFDGVLGAGETWTSRRRASEASRPGAITRDTSGGGDVDNAEKLAALGEGRAIDKGSDQSSVGASIQAEGIPVTSGSASYGQVNAEAAQVPNNVASTIPPGDGPPLPTEPKDLASVEWSYKDPSGAVQGV
jgi:PERQ amino acid-rich with GYF domain-containing protein